MPIIEIAEYLRLTTMRQMLYESGQRGVELLLEALEQEQLFLLVRARVRKFLDGYVQLSWILENIDHYIVSPRLGSRAGVLGAIALENQALGVDRG